jgi:hypothetical protein
MSADVGLPVIRAKASISTTVYPLIAALACAVLIALLVAISLEGDPQAADYLASNALP